MGTKSAAGSARCVQDEVEARPVIAVRLVRAKGMFSFYEDGHLSAVVFER